MTEPTKPTLTAVEGGTKKYKFIVGSEGGYDYLVTAKRDDVVLGVKPLIGVIPPTQQGQLPQLMVGARIRAARHKMEANSVGEISNLSSIKKTLTFEEAFPKITFQKSGKDRASLEMCISLPFTPWIKGSIEENLNKVRYHWKLVEWLEQNIAPDGAFVIEQDDFVQFVKDKFISLIADMEKQYVSSSPEVDVNMELQAPKSLFAKMLSPAKVKEDQIIKSGLKVVKADKYAGDTDAPDGNVVSFGTLEDVPPMSPEDEAQLDKDFDEDEGISQDFDDVNGDDDDPPKAA